MKKRVLSFLFIITLFSLTAVSASAVVNDTLKVGIRWGDTALEAANLENAVGSGYEFGYYDRRTGSRLSGRDRRDHLSPCRLRLRKRRDGDGDPQWGGLVPIPDNGYCLGIRPMGRHTETCARAISTPAALSTAATPTAL